MAERFNSFCQSPLDGFIQSPMQSRMCSNCLDLPPRGACCRDVDTIVAPPGPACVENVTEDECNRLGGDYQGDGVECDGPNVPCRRGDEHSWGVCWNCCTAQEYVTPLQTNAAEGWPSIGEFPEYYYPWGFAWGRGDLGDAGEPYCRARVPAGQCGEGERPNCRNFAVSPLGTCESRVSYVSPGTWWYAAVVDNVGKCAPQSSGICTSYTQEIGACTVWPLSGFASENYPWVGDIGNVWCDDTLTRDECYGLHLPYGHERKFWGAGTTCEQVIPPRGNITCCIRDYADRTRNCVNISNFGWNGIEDCVIRGGTWHGPDLTCGHYHCPGACCMGCGVCVGEVYRDECIYTLEGDWRGSGSQCWAEQCP